MHIFVFWVDSQIFDDLVQDCGISSVLAMDVEILYSGTNKVISQIPLCSCPIF